MNNKFSPIIARPRADEADSTYHVFVRGTDYFLVAGDHDTPAETKADCKFCGTLYCVGEVVHTTHTAVPGAADIMLRAGLDFLHYRDSDKLERLWTLPDTR